MFLLLLSATMLASCKKINKLVQFNLNYKTTVTIPSSTGINLPFNLLSPDVETDSEASFRSNDTRKDLINSILLTELKLTIESPSGEDFSFLKSAQIFIKAPGLEEAEIASITSVPENIGNTITLDPTGSDLAPFLKEDKFTLMVKAVTDEFLAQDHKIEIFTRFDVEGKLVNQE